MSLEMRLEMRVLTNVGCGPWNETHICVGVFTLFICFHLNVHEFKWCFPWGFPRALKIDITP